MKKLILLTVISISTVVSYSQSTNIVVETTSIQDTIALQQARIDALDSNYKNQTNLIYLQYQAQRNVMLRQIEKLQTNNTSQVIISSPASQTASN